MTVLLQDISGCYRNKIRLDMTCKMIFVLFIISSFLSSCGNSDKDVNEYNRKSLGIEEIKNADINYTLGRQGKSKTNYLR